MFISNVYKYPTHHNQNYRVIQFLLLPTSSNPLASRSILMLLYDDQVQLSSGWKEDQILFIYRPYLMKNASESLFGVEFESSVAFAHKEVSPMAEIIQTLLKNLNHSNTFDFHMLYGCITVSCLIEHIEFKDFGLVSTSSGKIQISTQHDSILKKYAVKQAENSFIDMSK